MSDELTTTTTSESPPPPPRKTEEKEKEEELVVIDFDKACAQLCGDPEFVMEVLADLIAECEVADVNIVTAVTKLETAQDKAAVANEFSQILRASHQMNGGASYLCCERLIFESKKLKKLAHADVYKDLDFDGIKSNKLIEAVSEAYIPFKTACKDIKEEFERRLLNTSITKTEIVDNI